MPDEGPPNSTFRPRVAPPTAPRTRPSPAGSAGAPLLGLRWVPDSSLRPLRYLPNPQASPAPVGGVGTGAGGRDWWTPARASTPGGAPRSGRIFDDDAATTATRGGARGASGTPGTAAGENDGGDGHAGGHHGEALKLQQHIRVLNQRLGEAHESVRQKVEQIRWLKEMTKDDASRARVARWMRGPLLRVFLGWKRVVRESTKRALAELQDEATTRSTRHGELQARCDELARDHAVLHAVLDHTLAAAVRRRLEGRLLECFRRWAPLRRAVGAQHAARAPLARRTFRWTPPPPRAPACPAPRRRRRARLRPPASTRATTAASAICGGGAARRATA